MREIKFRVVIPEHNINKVFWLENLIKPRLLFSTREFIIPWLLEGNEPDRYTGLKDKNGKEIYEGDIVQSWIRPVGEKIYEVKWITKSAEFSIQNKETCERTVEIIGNIYENPELLKDKK